MTICKPALLKESLDQNKCLLGLDVGSKTIGIAISDRDCIIASPLTVIKRKKFTYDASVLFECIDKNNIGALVVGLPIQMNGIEGRQAQSVRTFVDNLIELRPILVAFWDERLSTAAVERVMIENGNLSRSKRSKIIDKSAASYILQGLLDAHTA
jgi:putative Holliday junction resolvase